jgi:hypothetical protein
MVSWIGTQNQAGFNLSVAPQNRWEDATVWDTHRDLASCFTCKQVRLGFPSLASRLAEDAMMGGAHGTIVEGESKPS